MMNDNDKPLLLVTGSTGQLGQSFYARIGEFPSFRFRFCDRIELDVTHESRVLKLIQEEKPAAVINCAGYTNVERAESEEDAAFQINGLGSGYLADACEKANALLMHFSTDYVFDGRHTVPYKETDLTNPLSAYGRTKLWGERKIQDSLRRHLIIRLSWLYSNYGHNFYRTMIRLAREKGELSVVSDQRGCPTWAGQVAQDMLRWLERVLVDTVHTEYGIYHYSHEGECSWWDFARSIMEECGMDVPVYPIATGLFPTKAERPAYSKLDSSKFYTNTPIQAVDWITALKCCIKEQKANGERITDKS